MFCIFKMQFMCLLFLMGCFVALVYAYEENDIQVIVKGKEVEISVHDNPEVKTFFFSMDIGEECTSDYKFVHNHEKNSTFFYKIDINKELRKDDSLRIIGIFETKDKVIAKTYDLIIDGSGRGVKQDIPKRSDCVLSETIVNSKEQPCSQVLIFKEDFDLGLSGWTYERRSRIFDPVPVQEFVAYVNNTYLYKGHLYLNANWVNDTYFRLDGCTSKHNGDKNILKRQCGPLSLRGGVTIPPVHSAKLHSSFTFKYGRVEIRARMPIGDWLFPYLILQPEGTYSEDNYVNHLRIAYARGNKKLQDNNAMPIGGDVLFGSAVLWSMNGSKEYMTIKRNLNEAPFGEKFHIYTLIWHKDRIIFKVDGLKYGTITHPDVLRTFDLNECFIVLGLTAGGGLNFRQDYLMPQQVKFMNGSVKATELFAENTKEKPWEQPNLVIDYVHVYTTHANEE
ncbi:gram-negative bacteria-binding protein 2-like [Drosophila montana]|uniref:gram-negative bacteria-binding protein 2-like n=1 Tax=Drosophila montana TaxID=40370 RepID=UPI00313DE105